MTSFKKFAWSGSAVALAMIVAMSMVVQTAYAAAPTVTTAGDTAINLSTNATTGSGVFTAQGANIVLTAAGAEFTVASDARLRAPSGFEFDTTATVSAVAGGGTFAVGTVTVTASVITVDVTTVSAATNTLTVTGIRVRPITSAAATGDIGLDLDNDGDSAGGDDVADVGTLTVTANSTATNISNAITVVSRTPGIIAADGSQQSTIIVDVEDSNGVAAAGRQVTFTASIGGFGATGTTSTTAFTDAAGRATIATYHGTGTTGTDTIIVTAVAPLNLAATTTIELTGIAAGTPTQMSFISQTNNGHVAESAVTGYVTTAAFSNLVFKVGDSNNTGVNGQLLQISVDKGFIGASGADCSTLNTKTVTATTAGTGTTAGRVTVTYCADRASTQLGPVTVTVKNVSTPTIANVTHTLTAAGVPASIETTVTPGQLVVTVKDANGNLVADGTLVQVTIASTVGSVAPNTATGTKSGKATFAFALTGTSGNAIVTVTDSGSANTLVNQSVSLGQSTGGTPPPAGGTGTFAAAPSFGTGNVGSAVFQGGTIAQLVAAVTAAGGTSVWVQDSNGIWRSYNTLATGSAAFVNNGFNTAFAAGFGVQAVFVVR